MSGNFTPFAPNSRLAPAPVAMTRSISRDRPGSTLALGSLNPPRRRCLRERQARPQNSRRSAVDPRSGPPACSTNTTLMLIRPAIKRQSVRLSASKPRPERRSDDGQTIFTRSLVSENNALTWRFAWSYGDSNPGPLACHKRPATPPASGNRLTARSEAPLHADWEQFRAVRDRCDLPNSSQLIKEEQHVPRSPPAHRQPRACYARTHTTGQPSTPTAPRRGRRAPTTRARNGGSIKPAPATTGQTIGRPPPSLIRQPPQPSRRGKALPHAHHRRSTTARSGPGR